MEIDLIIEFIPKFLDGILVTFRIVVISLFFGSILSLPIALVQAYRIPFLAILADAYSYTMRGTPLLIQIYLLYYGLGQFEAIRESWTWYILKDAELCLLFGFSLNLAAYLAEILRGALLSVPKGEIEAAKAFGLSELKLIWHVTLPGAVRRIIPTLSNQVIFLVHSSVIASVIAINDVLGIGRELNLTYYLVVEGFIIAAGIYMVIIFSITLISRLIESHYGKFLRRTTEY